MTYCGTLFTALLLDLVVLLLAQSAFFCLYRMLHDIFSLIVVLSDGKINYHDSLNTVMVESQLGHIKL